MVIIYCRGGGELYALKICTCAEASEVTGALKVSPFPYLHRPANAINNDYSLTCEIILFCHPGLPTLGQGYLIFRVVRRQNFMSFKAMDDGRLKN